MNREQAEVILDAYREVTELGSTQEQAANALREVILDAMTEVRYSSWPKYPLVTYTDDKTRGPTITWSNTTAGSVNGGGAK